MILSALGVIDQRLIETRALLLTAVETLNTVETLNAGAPAEPHFRSRPAARPRASRLSLGGPHGSQTTRGGAR